MTLYSHALVGLCVLICINAEAALGKGTTTCQAGQICPTTGSSMLQTLQSQEKSELDLQKESPEPRDDEAELALSDIITDQDSDGGRPRLSGVCRDIDDNCGTKWKDRCDEEKVIWRCRKTCNLCDLCMDWAKNCATKWKDKCSQTNAQLICPQTCGVCSAATSVPTSAPTQVTTPATTPACEEKKVDGAHVYYEYISKMPSRARPSLESCIADCNGQCFGVTYNMNYQKCYIYPEKRMAGNIVKLNPNEDIGLRTYLCQATSDSTPETTPAATTVTTPGPAPVCYAAQHTGGYKYCEKWREAPMTKQPSVYACKAQCNGCYAVTYYWGKSNMNFYQNCYVYSTEQACGSLTGKTGYVAQTYLCGTDEI